VWAVAPVAVPFLGGSRARYLDFTDSQALALFLACHEQAFHDFGGVPEEILYDRVKTVWMRHDHGDPAFHPGFIDFAEHDGFRPKRGAARASLATTLTVTLPAATA
jgi:transposase